MSREIEIKIDGDRWSVRLSKHPPRPGAQVVLFFPMTTSQRPYRVVEVSEERIPETGGLESLSEREIRELYADSKSMDFPHTYA